jgi:hypothetical protein
LVRCLRSFGLTNTAMQNRPSGCRSPRCGPCRTPDPMATRAIHTPRRQGPRTSTRVICRSTIRTCIRRLRCVCMVPMASHVCCAWRIWPRRICGHCSPTFVPFTSCSLAYVTRVCIQRDVMGCLLNMLRFYVRSRRSGTDQDRMGLPDQDLWPRAKNGNG